MTRRDDHLEPFDFGPGHPPTHLGTVRSRRWLVPGVTLCLLLAGGGYLYWFDRPLVERWIANTPVKEWLADTPLAPAASSRLVYKWRDGSGAWNLTDTMPPPGVHYEIHEYPR